MLNLIRSQLCRFCRWRAFVAAGRSDNEMLRAAWWKGLERKIAGEI